MIRETLDPESAHVMVALTPGHEPAYSARIYYATLFHFARGEDGLENRLPPARVVDFIENQVAEHGHVEANGNWKPSCAFLEDSADALYRLMTSGTPGTYQLEGNPGLSFFEILTALKARHGTAWEIVKTDGPHWDHRMHDDRVQVQPITVRLKSPETGDATPA